MWEKYPRGFIADTQGEKCDFCKSPVVRNTALWADWQFWAVQCWLFRHNEKRSGDICTESLDPFGPACAGPALLSSDSHNWRRSFVTSQTPFVMMHMTTSTTESKEKILHSCSLRKLWFCLWDSNSKAKGCIPADRERSEIKKILKIKLNWNVSETFRERMSVIWACAHRCLLC